MPELPDVENFRRRLPGHAYGRQITGVRVGAPRLLDELSPARLRKTLRGSSFRTSRRHGKHLFLSVAGNGWLMLHFGMSGGLEPLAEKGKTAAHERLRIEFADGTALAYTSVRMLGHVALTPTPGHFVEQHGLGPDALDPKLKATDLADILAADHRSAGAAVKSILMDQSRIAGIGNVYADEILFQAGIHPLTQGGQLGRQDIGRLFRSLREVLHTAIDCGAGGAHFNERLPRGFLLPHRQRGGRCPRCGTPLERFKLDGRTGYRCPHHQPQG